MASVRVELMSMENRWNYMDVGKTCLSATSSTTNPTRTGLGMNNGMHDHPSYLCCPDVLSLVGDPLSGNECGSPNHT